MLISKLSGIKRGDPFSFTDAIVELCCMVNEYGEVVNVGVRGPRGSRSVLTVSDICEKWGWSRRKWYEFTKELSEQGILYLNGDKYLLSESFMTGSGVVFTPKPAPVKKQKVRRDPKLFYEEQCKLAAEEKNTIYPVFVEFLFGGNQLKKKLDGVLSIREQLTFKEFVSVNKLAIEHQKKISDIVLLMNNNPDKYCKGKVSLNLTLRTWVTSRFNK